MKFLPFRVLFSLAFALLLVGIMIGLFAHLNQAQASEGALKNHPYVSAMPNIPVTIIFWHQHTKSREAFLQQLVDEFNAGNSYQITVIAEYGGSYGDIYNKLIALFRNGGALPNIVVSYSNQFSEYARYGKVHFLNEYIADPTIGLTDTVDFLPGVLDYYRLDEYGDQIAGLQNGRSIEVMYYNAELLAGAGLGTPTTWAAFEHACQATTSAGISGTVISVDASRFATWLWSRGGELLSSDSDHARFAEQLGIDALLVFQRLIGGGYARLVQAYYEDMTAFGMGETVFTFGSSAGIPYYRMAMEGGANDAWGVTHVPAVAGYEVVDSYGAGQGILAHNEVEDRAAWIFIKWLADTEQTARWSALSGYFPVRISATTHPSITQKLASDPQYTQAYNLMPLGRSEPGVRGYDSIRGMINTAMYATLRDGQEVTSTLQTASASADELLDESGPESAVIPPAGGEFIYTNTQDLQVVVQFPPGSFALTQTVSYVPLNDLPTDGLAFALLPETTFSQPVTITIHYRDEDLTGMDEAHLMLYSYDWSAGLWIDATPCGGYWRDLANNILQAMVCHFSDYAMLGWANWIYLPVVLR